MILKICISFSRFDLYAEKVAHYWHTLGLEKAGIKFKKVIKKNDVCKNGSVF